MAAVTKRASLRDRLIRLIHVAKRDLMLDDDTYRAALFSVTGKPSSSELCVHELNAVLDHLKGKGFKVCAHRQPRPLAHGPESRKIRALWLFMGELGAVKNTSEPALAAYVKRMTGVDALQWLDGRQTERVIETLKKWAMRFLPERVEKMAGQANAAEIGPDLKTKIQIALSQAYASTGFDMWHHAYELLAQALRGKNREHP